MDPWTKYTKRGKKLGIMELLCSGHSADLLPLLDAWLRHVGNPDNAPDNLPAFHRIPLDSSINAMERLVKAGADVDARDANGASVVERFVRDLMGVRPLAGQSLLNENKACSNLMWVCQHASSSPRLSDLDIRMDGQRLDVFSLFYPNVEDASSRVRDEDFIRFFLGQGPWDIDWKTSQKTQKLLTSLMAWAELPARVWQEGGVDWSGKSESGLPLPHLILSYPRYNFQGKPVLPSVICDAIMEEVFDPTDEAGAGWSPMGRIKVIEWANQEDARAVLAWHERHLIEKGTDATSAPSVPRVRRV